MSDHAAFHEVDEAVRKDELKAWWGRYGTWIIAVAAIVVLAAAGLVGWRRYDASLRGEASAAYTEAIAKIPQDRPAALSELEKQAASAPEPYRSLAALVAAQLRQPIEAQVTALTAVAPGLSSPDLADLANVIAAYKSIDTPNGEAMVAKLEPLTASGRPFRLSVLELQALVAGRKGDTKHARDLWTEIARDAEVPQGLAQRAASMINFYGPAEAK
ncbi:MAG: tetratricopeptide repeat protein [Alphaproteobacteria bacterium]|nr:tetratricopeptide repeat protein [Alphaproteobacteria bacterium]